MAMCEAAVAAAAPPPANCAVAAGASALLPEAPLSLAAVKVGAAFACR